MPAAGSRLKTGGRKKKEQGPCRMHISVLEHPATRSANAQGELGQVQVREVPAGTRKYEDAVSGEKVKGGEWAEEGMKSANSYK